MVSDALFYNEIDGQFEQHPLPVLRHGIRGTQNINKGSTLDEANTTSTAKRQEVSNIQTTDTAKLAPTASALAVQFGMRFLDLKDALFACAPGAKDSDESVAALRKSVDSFVERAKSSDAIQLVAQRVARNICNGRWLWRNRLIAKTIQIEVARSDDLIARFDALSISTNDFEAPSADEKKVATVIAAGLAGKARDGITVTARLEFGVKGAVEVFASQNYIEKKPKGFARSLYCLGNSSQSNDLGALRTMGQAALRDQKVSNALRTIDTWYPEFKDFNRPLPIEPNGASLDFQRFFRDSKNASAFELMRKLNQIDPVSPDGLFITASLIRGGVYSESGKDLVQ